MPLVLKDKMSTEKQEEQPVEQKNSIFSPSLEGDPMTAKCIEHREHPALFSAPMVRALLADRKHVTRRLSKQWLKVKAGDVLWCRETLRLPDGEPWVYEADHQAVMVSKEDETAMLVWAHHKDQDYCSSMFMPRWACRIALECEEDARLERLQDITEEDAIAEGVERCGSWWRCYSLLLEDGGKAESARASFSSLWSTLHTKPGERWEDNPEVVRVGRFRRVPNV